MKIGEFFKSKRIWTIIILAIVEMFQLGAK